MFGFDDTKQQMQDLLLETRSYVGLQKKALVVETRDKLSVLLSRLAIAVVCLVLGGMALLFFSFFLAYIIGQALGNVALGFAAVTLLVLLLLALFWYMRVKWVIIPITSMLNNLFTVDEKPLESGQVSEELNESRDRMSSSFQQLIGTRKESSNHVEDVSNWVSRAFAAYEGLRLGLSLMRAFTSVFGGKRRRKRR